MFSVTIFINANPAKLVNQEMEATCIKPYLEYIVSFDLIHRQCTNKTIPKPVLQQRYKNCGTNVE